MNSAMMPREGHYRCEKITPKQAKKIVGFNPIMSSIGYPQVAEILTELLDREIPLSRSKTDLEDGDVIIACRLKYRVNPREKAGRRHGNQLSDYEFFKVEYEEKK